MINALYAIIHKYTTIEYAPYLKKTFPERIKLLKYAKFYELSEYHKACLANHDHREALERKYT